FHRDLPAEVPVPFPLEVVYRDEHIVVADKPHFLATTPRGSHVAETALARLRRDLGIPELGAAHRLDRLTAGLVLFTVRPEVRGAYQTLFRDRRVHKEYEAVAPYDPGLTLPRTVRSRIVKARGVLTARGVPGEPNAETRVELLGRREDGLGRYRLLPRTGQTHQLRVHMNALGVPLLGDPLYPEVTPPVPAGDFRRPLQLLARTLEFTDPVTREPNAETRVELLGRREDGLGRYRLLPRTGQTHQLRVHMNALGVPLLGDPLYPEVTPPVPAGDFRRPLQLLARTLEFTDPVT